MPVKPVFDLRAILPVLIMFIVTAVETVGDISGVMEGGLGRGSNRSGACRRRDVRWPWFFLCSVIWCIAEYLLQSECWTGCHDKGSNRFALATGAIFLILCGLCPKLAALVSIMPQSVLGGAAVMMIFLLLSSAVFS